MTEIEKIVEYNNGREVIYACFSRIFINTLNDNEFKMLEEIMPFIKLLQTESEDDKFLNEGIVGLIKFVDEYKSLQEDMKEIFKNEINREYTRLFCLGNGVDLSESVYLSPSHLTGQEQELKVHNTYKKYNFKMDCSSNEPADHISYELMFMSFLAKNISKKYIADKEQALKLLDVQKLFLEEHILKYIDLLIKRTINFRESYRLYLPALYFIKGYIDVDYKYIIDMLDY